MIDFRVDQERCIQCGECVADCPMGVLAMEEQPVMTDEAGCIRCQHCLAICPTAAVSVLGLDPEKSDALDGGLPTAAQLTLLVKARRTVRRYLDEDVEPGLLDELLAVSCHAPTGVNAMGVLFTVVRERAVMARLREEVMAGLAAKKKADQLPEGLIGQYMGYSVKAWQEEGRDIIFRGAPHLLVTSAPAAAPCPVQDTHIALATFQLLAHAHGLGTVWDGLFMMAMSVLPELGPRLGIPADHVLGYAMAFGRPAVEYHRTVQRGPAQVNVVG